MRDSRVDGVFGDIAANPEIVVVSGFFRQTTTLFPHLVGGLPGADDHLADPAHGLTVAGDDRKGAHVMQDVLGGDGFAPDTAFGKGHVLGDRLVEVVTDHQHVEMFFERVHREGPGRVGRRRQYVLVTTYLDDVWRVPAACAFGVKGVDRTALDRGDSVLDKAALVQGVSVDHHLHVHGIGDRKAAIDGCRCGTPVFVQLQGAGPGLDLLFQRSRQRCVALARKGKVHGKGVCGLQHASDVPWSGCTGRGKGAMCRAGSAAQHGGQPGMQRILDLLRTYEMNMAVEPSCGQDATLACNGFCPGTDDDCDAGLGIRVPSLADGGNAPVLQPDVRLVDAAVIDDQRIGDDGIHCALDTRRLRLPHPVTDDLAATEFNLFAIGGKIALHLDDQIRIGKPYLVSGRRTEHGCILAAR